MKRILRLSGLFIAALTLLCSARETQASHYQGSDLTYGWAAPNTYQVTFKVYRDCSGISLDAQYGLNIQCMNGGGASRTVQMLPIGNPTSGNPYCASSNKNVCPPNSSANTPDNYQTNTYTAIVTFTAAEIACSNGMVRLSTTNSARPGTRNLTGQNNLYSEATIKLGTYRPTLNGPLVEIANNSVQFDANNIPIPFFCAENENILYTLNALDFDGGIDSISYKLRQPWSALNTPIGYLTAAASSISNPKNTPGTPPTPPAGQVASVNTPSSPYSVNWPIGSWTADWTQAAPVPTKFFQFDARTGQIKFNSPKFMPGASNLGYNKYALAVEITEWRKPAATAAVPNPTKRSMIVGTVVRDILMIVVDCGGNKPPQTTVPPLPPKVAASFVGDSVINVQTCNTSRVKINFTDINPTDILDIKLTQNLDPRITAFPIGATSTPKGLINNNTTNPQYIFDITPEPTDVNRDFLINVVITDNSCPIKGVSARTYRVHVVKQNLVDVQGNETRELCFGDTDSLQITLNRPDSLKNQPINYTYTWSIHPNTPNGDGLPANVNTKNILINPTDTTRYLLSVTNGVAGCIDTVSVLVNVSGQPKFDRTKDANNKEKSFTALRVAGEIDRVNGNILGADNTTDLDNLLKRFPHTGDSIRFGMRSVVVPNLLNNKEQIRSFTYTWSSNSEKGKKYLASADTTSSILTFFPFTTERYTLFVKNATGVCVDSASIVIKVSPFFLPNIITPNGDSKNDVFKVYSLPEGTTFQVFNRWGVLVKEFKDYKNDFGGEGVSDGTYYYYVKTPNGGPTYKGWFDIVRK